MGLNVKELSPLRFKCVRNEEYTRYLQNGRFYGNWQHFDLQLSWETSV